jgi:hypothetical protein
MPRTISQREYLGLLRRAEREHTISRSEYLKLRKQELERNRNLLIQKQGLELFQQSLAESAKRSEHLRQQGLSLRVAFSF